MKGVIILLLVVNTLLFSEQQTLNEQDNFYNAVNKKWLKDNKIPKGYSSWNNFNVLDKKVSDDLRKIIEENVKKRETFSDGSNEQKLVDFYVSILDYESRDKEGMKPIKYLLDRVETLSDKKDISSLIAYLFNNNINALFSVYIGSDFKDSDTNILYLDSVKLGMADRDYYLEDTEKSLKIQKAYKEYLSKLFTLSGYDNAEIEEKVNNVFDFEKKLALAMLKREDMRNPEKLYNPYTVSELEKSFPMIKWKDYLEKTELIKAKKIVVSEPDYIKMLNDEIATSDLKVIKDYLESVILIENSNILSRDFENIAFEYSKVFSGIDEMLPDNERAFKMLNNVMGNLLGRIYVEKYFSEDEKKDVTLMIKDIRDTYEDRIKKLDWMSETSKKKAIKKLDTMVIKVGYPDKWEDYSEIEIKTYKKDGSLYSNIKNISDFERKKAVKKLNGKVDKSEWGMSPQTINAYYNPTANEIVFPAGILQAPFYDYNSSKAKNYGGIGVIIGHEISHAFDDEGPKFDEYGNLKNWWTKNDRKNYNLRTEELAKQYSKYALNNEKLNGKLTLGENIADLGGVTVALELAKRDPKNNLKEFFESYATVWRNLATNERISYLIKVDPHSPGIYRVNGVLTNIDEFYNVYNIKEGSEMYTKPENRIRIW